MARRLSGLLSIFLFFLLAGFAAAQSASSLQSRGVEEITLGQSAVPLCGPWRFHIGDSPIDPRTGQPLWAEPDFDDSQWETVDLTPGTNAIDPTNGWTGYVPGWTARGHSGAWGYGWYRIRVLEEEPNEPEADKLAVWDVDDIYQFFGDGQLLGTFGDFRPGKLPVSYWSLAEMYNLPSPRMNLGQSTHSATRLLAFRVWCGANNLTQDPDGCGLHVAPVMGGAAATGAAYQKAWIEIILSNAPTAVQAVLDFLLAIAVGSLFFFDPSDRTYLWLAGVFLLTATLQTCYSLFSWTKIASQTTIYLLIDGVLTPLITGGWVLTWWFWFRLRRPRWLPKAVPVVVVLYGLSKVLGDGVFPALTPDRMQVALRFAANGLGLVLLGLLIRVITEAIRQRGREGWLALPAVVLVGIAQFEVELLVSHVPVYWFVLGVGVGLDHIAYAALAIVIFVLLLRRLQQSLHRQRQMAHDVKQAQEVQQVILPERSLALPGFAIQSEYRPAREVGGDFFQIIPQKSDGSLLIVAGDVTGKGLKAGMLVALLVGAIRSTADWSADPVVILRALNQRLMGRGDAQATCLALRIEADGSATLANAGHLPPYLNGKPVEVEGSLPLGMIDAPEFPVLRFRLEQGDRLMLLSDGIAEATNANGQLFGFERVQELIATASSAAHVAGVAQRFGQEDDISVIAVTRIATPQPA